MHSNCRQLSPVPTGTQLRAQPIRYGHERFREKGFGVWLLPDSAAILSQGMQAIAFLGARILHTGKQQIELLL